MRGAVFDSDGWAVVGGDGDTLGAAAQDSSVTDSAGDALQVVAFGLVGSVGVFDIKSKVCHNLVIF